MPSNKTAFTFLQNADSELYQTLRREISREANTLELIASENFVSYPVLEMAGGVMTNKYAEGYPGKRYYDGCEHVDVAETLAIERLKKSPIKQFIFTDTVHVPEGKILPNMRFVTVSGIFGEAIRRIYKGESVSALFNF